MPEQDDTTRWPDHWTDQWPGPSQAPSGRTLLPSAQEPADPWANLPPTHPSGMPLVPPPVPAAVPTLLVDVRPPDAAPPRPAGRTRAAWLGAFAATAVGVLAVIGVVAAFVLRDGPGCDPAARGRTRLAPVAAVVPLAVAAPPLPTSWTAGIVTFYGPGTTAGACASTSIPPTRYTAALGPVEYAGGAACGTYVRVRGARGTILVKVTNLCPECPPGHLDLSDEAFAALDDPGKGRVPMSYRAVRDPAVGTLTVTVKDGSNPYWLAIHVDDHGNPLRSVEVASGQQPFTAMRLQDYGYWLDADGAGPGPFRVRVTDVSGHQAVLTGVRLRPGTTQRTGVRLYGPGAGAAPSATASPSATGRTTTTTARASGPATSTVTKTNQPTRTAKPSASRAAATAAPATGNASAQPTGAAVTTAPARC